MKRRSFLRSAAAVLPAAGLQSFALAQTSTFASEQPIRIVGAGQDEFGQARSLGFSSILFKVTAEETNGGLFVVEHQNLQNGGPPFHFHPHQEEWFYVMEGEVAFQVGESRKHLGAGDSILGPRGIPHTFVPVGKKPARMLIAFTPAGKMEEFFRAAAIPNAPPTDAAFYRRFDVEVVGPSPFAA